MRPGWKTTALCLGALCAAPAAAPLRAQVPPVPQALRDSVANPPKAQGSGAMRFLETHIDAGRIGEDDLPPSYTFRWTNDGDAPLVITRVETTCGCAVPSFDRQPVLRGGEGSVTVTYHPKRHPGNFHRRIFVFTQLSAQRPTAILDLTGHVTPSSALPAADYPYAMNGLRLKQREVRMDGTQRRTERIACLNAGRQPLRISADSLLLPPYVRFECEAATLEPGATCDLIFRFDPAKAPERLPEQVPVILRGLGLPPVQSTVRILFGERPRPETEYMKQTEKQKRIP